MTTIKMVKNPSKNMKDWTVLQEWGGEYKQPLRDEMLGFWNPLGP